jgi:hypothetical protein
MIDYREYENGITDVLRFVAGSDVEVERDVLVPGRRSGVERQVDVLVRGSLFGLTDATLAVDCKLWKKKLDVSDVGAFLTYLEDVGADLGLLITTAGYTPGAKKLAHDARGVRAEVLTLLELEQWSPAGSVHVSYRLPAERADDARAALVRAGLRVREDRGLKHRDDQIVLEAFRYPRGEGEPSLRDVAEEALTAAGLPVDVAASGTAIGGGTPAHRWLEVTDRGHPTSLKILVSTEAEVERELDRIATEFNLIRQTLDVVRPADWPITGLFGLPPAG